MTLVTKPDPHSTHPWSVACLNRKSHLKEDRTFFIQVPTSNYSSSFTKFKALDSIELFEVQHWRVLASGMPTNEEGRQPATETVEMPAFVSSPTFWTSSSFDTKQSKGWFDSCENQPWLFCWGCPCFGELLAVYSQQKQKKCLTIRRDS